VLIVMNNVRSSLLKQVGAHACSSVDDAGEYLLKERPKFIVIHEDYAALMEELFSHNLQIPLAIVTDQNNPKSIRGWMAQGASFVWKSENWEQELLALFVPPSVVEEPVKVTEAPQIEQPEPQYLAPISQRIMTIGISSIGSRMGATHTAIRAAVALAKQKHSVACVEYISSEADKKKVFTSFLTDEETNYRGGFRRNGVDFFANRTYSQLLELYSTDYDYIVIDFTSPLLTDQVSEMYRAEWQRCDVQMIMLGAATWDFQMFVDVWQRSDQTNFKKQWNVIVNYANGTLYDELVGTLSPLHLNVDFFMNEFVPDPFHPQDTHDSITRILSPILPEKIKKNGFLKKMLGTGGKLSS